MRLLSVLTVSTLVSGCASLDYKPVTYTNFDQLVSEGCAVPEARFNVQAYVSAAYKETLVLWDGIDSGKTAAVRLPREGIVSKAQGVVGDSRYEVNLDSLRRLRGSKESVNVSLLCKDKDRTPVLLRLRYWENGEEQEIEFKV